MLHFGVLHVVVGKSAPSPPPPPSDLQLEHLTACLTDGRLTLFINIASSILNGTGSVGLSMIYWALGFLTSITSFAVYLEFASYFSNRSGSEVVYLEQSFPKPRWLFPTTFAFQSVVLSFSSGNAIGR